MNGELMITLMDSLPQSWETLIISLRSNASVTKDYETLREALIQENLARQLRAKKGDSVTRSAMNANANDTVFKNRGQERERDQRNKNSGRFGGSCHNCKKKGHRSSYCWAPGVGKARQGPSQSKDGFQSSANVSTREKARRYSFMAIKKLQSKHAPGGGNSATCILDSGASDHMSNTKSMFVLLNLRP